MLLRWARRRKWWRLWRFCAERHGLHASRQEVLSPIPFQATSSTSSSPIADFFDLLAKRHDTMRTSANVQRADKERRAELTKALRLESEQFNGQDERALLIYGADEALSAAIAPGATFIAMAVRCGSLQRK